MKAFEIEVQGKIVDYRVGSALNLQAVQKYFSPVYTTVHLEQNNRHVTGTLTKNGIPYFLKLATSEGISALTKNEFAWNTQYASLNPSSTRYRVPRNIDSGWYEDTHFYLITDYFTGSLLSDYPASQNTKLVRNNIDEIIALSEHISSLPITMKERNNLSHTEFFWEKTKAWYTAIPKTIRAFYHVDSLLSIVDASYRKLPKAARHGDFTPWHLFIFPDKTIGLVDGEHALENGVLYYDIAYFIQRVFTVLKDIELAKSILHTLIQTRRYNQKHLYCVLAARAIGGYVDESFATLPSYESCEQFQSLIRSHVDE